MNPDVRKPSNFAFIDSQNVNLAIQAQGWKLDFSRFRRYLSDKYHVTQAYLFIGYVQGNQPLYTKLQKDGYILVFKPTLQLPGGKIKGNVDAELVLHAMIEYPNYDQAVIVTGDGDFHCLVKHLNDNHKLLRLLVPNVHHYSALLKPFAAERLDFMNNLRNKLEFRK
jgi:uncharacterized LabA/DUF88 family protein